MQLQASERQLFSQIEENRVRGQICVQKPAEKAPSSEIKFLARQLCKKCYIISQTVVEAIS